MGRILFIRLWHGLIVVIGVTVIVFFVTRVIGDPVDVMLPMEATEEQRAVFEKQLGFDRPLIVQFLDYVGGVIRLDLGQSLWQNRPAMDIIVERLPYSLVLSVAAITLASVIAVPLGIFAALKPGGILDKVIVIFGLTALSVPQFWLGLLLIMLFAVQLGWLPPGGAGSPLAMLLPTITLAIPTMTRLIMITRSQVIDELNSSYVKTSQAKGMPLRRIVGLHALRNCAVPVLTLIVWEFVRIVSGYTVIVETVFSWPGLGFIALQAIERQDLILLQAIVLVFAIIVVLVNLVADVIYKMIDPRIKLG